MNICSLVGVNVQLYRRAFILAHSRLVIPVAVPVRGKRAIVVALISSLRLCDSACTRKTMKLSLISVSQRCNKHISCLLASKRDAHNGLYQMVKKRTLEARTKLQTNAYPNNHPSLARNEHPSASAEMSLSPHNHKSFKTKLPNECGLPPKYMSSSSLPHSPSKYKENVPKGPTKPQDLDKVI